MRLLLPLLFTERLNSAIALFREEKLGPVPLCFLLSLISQLLLLLTSLESCNKLLIKDDWAYSDEPALKLSYLKITVEITVDTNLIKKNVYINIPRN